MENANNSSINIKLSSNLDYMKRKMAQIIKDQNQMK